MAAPRPGRHRLHERRVPLPVDLATGKEPEIAITLGAEQPFAVPFFRAVSANVGGAALSPTGARVVFDARGDLFSVPAKDGATRA